MMVSIVKRADRRTRLLLCRDSRCSLHRNCQLAGPTVSFPFSLRLLQDIFAAHNPTSSAIWDAVAGKGTSVRALLMLKRCS